MVSHFRGKGYSSDKQIYALQAFCMIQIRYSTRRKNMLIIRIAENKEEISCKDEGAEWEI